MKAKNFEEKRLEFIAMCERNCSCDSGRCSVCHIRRAGEAVIEAARDPVAFEDMFAFYEEAGLILERDPVELQKQLHPALKKLFS